MKENEYYALICNHCGSLMEKDMCDENDKVIETSIPVFKNKEEALRASINMFDDTGTMHPKVGLIEIIIKNEK